MNKRILIVFLVFAVVVLAGISVYLLNKKDVFMRKNAGNTMMTAHKAYKKDCKIFEANAEKNQTYINQHGGFHFLLIRDLLICERNFTTENGADELSEISVWDKNDFYSEVSRIGPIVIIHVNRNADINNLQNQLPQPVIMSKEEKVINGISAIRKEVKSSLCITPDCPIVRIYELVVHGRSFVIEERGDKDIIIDSLEFK